ncbi:MAG: FKBP-type peptidyl-prolyl cis-trans isomerase [Caulobacteraceae bacterium]|nr:FKBP-type peptidyl-prolyl cis-trans isomerase [Caulobacter sp.]
MMTPFRRAASAALAAALLALPAAACHAQQPPAGGGATGHDSAWLITNQLQPGVVTLPSGLQYKVVHSGPVTGPHPSVDDEVKVNYEGSLLNGTVFDSSFKRGEPAVFPIAGLIKAWQIALPLMRPGDEWMLYVPPSLGYGETGAGGDIPGGAVLVFRMQLLGVLPKAGDGTATG